MRVRLVAVTDVRGTITSEEALKKGQPVNWSSREDKAFFKELTTSVGVVLMGRKTFETLGGPLSGRFNVVLSSTGKFQTQRPPDLVLSGDVDEIIEKVRRLGYNDICIIGGQSVYSQFLNSGLVTDFYITIEPLVLPDGLNLFRDIHKIVELNLEKIIRLNDSGTLNLHFKVRRV